MFFYNCFLYVIYMHNICIHLYILLRLIYLLFSTLSITWRCEVGTDNWVQCNDAPVKICKYPVSGLVEGRSYTFRVRAVNSAGVSRPSRASEAVAALDPLDLKRLQGRSLRSQGPSVSCFFPPAPNLYLSLETVFRTMWHGWISWALSSRQGHVKGGDTLKWRCFTFQGLFPEIQLNQFRTKLFLVHWCNFNA